MRRLFAVSVFLCVVAGIGATIRYQVSAVEPYVDPVGKPMVSADATPKPIDVNMHDFMEGVFQLPYQRLKKSMAAEPADRPAWKALRSDALILAEGGNLLLARLPEKDADAWIKYSVDSRDAGAELIKAAKAKNFADATKAYQSMLTHCNACHQQFNDGKNQLAP